MRACKTTSPPRVGLESGSIPNPNDLLDDDIFDDGVVFLPILEEETRNVFIELSSDHEVQVSSDPIPHKIDHVVTFQGHSIYKSTLVSEMNGNPYLSKDRLTRMKNSIYFYNLDDYLAVALSTTSLLLGLGSDVGVYFKDSRGFGTSSTVMAAKKRMRGTPIAVNRGVENSIFYKKKLHLV